MTTFIDVLAGTAIICVLGFVLAIVLDWVRYAVTLDLADGRQVDATGTRRRLQALAATGWPQTRLAALIGWDRGNFYSPGGGLHSEHPTLARLLLEHAQQHEAHTHQEAS